jgi:hypothetical protein
MNPCVYEVLNDEEKRNKQLAPQFSGEAEVWVDDE